MNYSQRSRSGITRIPCMLLGLTSVLAPLSGVSAQSLPSCDQQFVEMVEAGADAAEFTSAFGNGADLAAEHELSAWQNSGHNTILSVIWRCTGHDTEDSEMWENDNHWTPLSLLWEGLGHFHFSTQQWIRDGHGLLTSAQWELDDHYYHMSRDGHEIGVSHDWREGNHEYNKSEQWRNEGHGVPLSREWENANHFVQFSLDGHRSDISREWLFGHGYLLSKDWVRTGHNFHWSYKRDRIRPIPRPGDDLAQLWAERMVALK